MTTKIENYHLSNADSSWKQIFFKSTTGFIPSGQDHGKKYLDLQTEQTFIMEVKESEETRKVICMELDDLKGRLKVLLDKNENHPFEEKLEIQDFNIDGTTTEQMKEEVCRFFIKDSMDNLKKNYLSGQKRERSRKRSDAGIHRHAKQNQQLDH